MIKRKIGSDKLVRPYFSSERSIPGTPSRNLSPCPIMIVGIPTLPFFLMGSKYSNLSLKARKIFRLLMLSVISIYWNSTPFSKRNSLSGSHSGQSGLPKTVILFI